MPRPVLSFLVLAALAGTALAMPVVAYADTTGTIEVTGSTLTFDPTGRSGTAEVAYTCADPDAVTTRFELQTALFQPVHVDDKPPVAVPEKDLFVTCDGTARTTTVTFTRTYVSDEAPAVVNGKAQVGFYVGSGGPGELGPVYQDVMVTGVTPPDTRASVTITLNAHPEPTREGSRTTVEGTITRAGKAYAKKKVSLLFTPDGSDEATRVATVTASAKGALKARVRATEPGTYRFVSTETSKTKAGRSEGDHVAVLPALRRFASCDDLNAIYPHGVGREGAKDKTSGAKVTGFAVDGAQYTKNQKSDRDRDGIACEKA